jgi:hypothetical protein
MTSSTETDPPICPDCSAPMRLTRVLPTVLPKDYAPQTRVFVCASCGTVVTHTIHDPATLQRSGLSR